MHKLIFQHLGIFLNLIKVWCYIEFRFVFRLSNIGNWLRNKLNVWKIPITTLKLDSIRMHTRRKCTQHLCVDWVVIITAGHNTSTKKRTYVPTNSQSGDETSPGSISTTNRNTAIQYNCMTSCTWLGACILLNA